MPPFLFFNYLVLPDYTTLPSLSTTILSQFYKVESLWAIVNTVLSLNALAITSWISLSFFTSIFAVASSIRIMRLFFKNALHMHKSCFYPTDKF